MTDTDTDNTKNIAPARRVAVLLAKASLTSAATAEMERLTRQVADSGTVGRAVYAFSEQGLPALRDALLALTDGSCDEVLVLPLMMPMEPGFRVWLTRAVLRWRGASAHLHWPVVRIAPEAAGTAGTDTWLRELSHAALQAPALAQNAAAPRDEGSVVPLQQCRVLVCQGGPCNNAGAAVVWGHLRNAQKSRELRTTGRGVMTAKTSCLGPCNLAPVLQVFPEGTYYGGVHEAEIDQIIDSHLLGGVVVQALAYAPLPGKQFLRKK